MTDELKNIHGDARNMSNLEWQRYFAKRMQKPTNTPNKRTLIYLWQLSDRIGKPHVWMCPCTNTFGISETVFTEPDKAHTLDGPFKPDGFHCPCGIIHSWKDMAEAKRNKK